VKNIIFYFSGTGNSLRAAQVIGKKLGECELIALSQFSAEKMITAAQVGIICPVYYWGIPKAVRKFLSKLKIQKDTYIFSIVTMGTNAGNALQEIDILLKQAGTRLSYGMEIKMPDNYSTLLGIQKLQKHEKLLDDAEEKLEMIAMDIKKKKTREIGKWDKFKEILFQGKRNALAGLDKKFVIEDFSSCKECQLCIKQCPVGNIRMQNGTPVWQNQCEFCLACISNCPKEVIQIGKKTKGKPRYRNPMTN